MLRFNSLSWYIIVISQKRLTKQTNVWCVRVCMYFFTPAESLLFVIELVLKHWPTYQQNLRVSRCAFLIDSIVLITFVQKSLLVLKNAHNAAKFQLCAQRQELCRTGADEWMSVRSGRIFRLQRGGKSNDVLLVLQYARVWRQTLCLRMFCMPYCLILLHYNSVISGYWPPVTALCGVEVSLRIQTVVYQKYDKNLLKKEARFLTTKKSWKSLKGCYTSSESVERLPLSKVDLCL